MLPEGRIVCLPHCPSKENGFQQAAVNCFWKLFLLIFLTNFLQRKTKKEEYMSPKEDKKKKKRKRKRVLRKKERDIPTMNGQKIRNLTTK